MMRFLILIRTWIMNILLAGAAVFFGYQAYEIWSGNDNMEVNRPVQKPLRPNAVRRVAYRRMPRYQTYEVIPGKNLFSSDRREKLPETSPAPSPAKPAKPLDRRFALFGIVINNNEKKALISNLDKKNASEKKVVWVKVGDKIGDLSVTEIKSGQITLTQGASTHTVRLSDQTSSQRRSKGRKVKKRTGTAPKNIKKTKINGTGAKGSKPSS